MDGDRLRPQFESAAEDYTEFNPDYSTRRDGKDFAARIAAVPPDVTTAMAEMQNARVRVYGAAAVLSLGQ